VGAVSGVLSAQLSKRVGESAHLVATDSYSLINLECHSISFSILKLIGLFSTERGKRDIKNQMID